MLTASIKKITVVLSLWSLIVSQSVAATIEALYEGQSGTIGNLTLMCVGNSINGLTSASSSSSTNYGALTLTGLVTGSIGLAFGAIFSPDLKTCCKVCCINPCSRLFSSCSIPRSCRRESTEDMDITTDLLYSSPPKSYKQLFKNLDASLVSVGWGKYPVIDEDEKLVGYRYLFLGSDKQEKASIYLVGEYQTLNAQKGLLRLNKSLRPRALKVETLEAIYTNETDTLKDKTFYVYEAGQGRIIGGKFSQQSVLQRASDSRNSLSSINLEPDTFLQKFQQAFSPYTFANAQRFFDATLALTKNTGVRLEINNVGNFARLDCGFLNSPNFYLYYIMPQK